MSHLVKGNRQLIIAGAANNRQQPNSLLLEQMNLILASWKGESLQSSVSHQHNHQQQNQQQNQQQQQDNSSASRDGGATAAPSTPPPAAPATSSSTLRSKQWLDDAVNYNVETCRSALALFASAAGAFSPHIRNMSDYLVDVVEHLSTENAKQAAQIKAIKTQARQNELELIANNQSGGGAAGGVAGGGAASSSLTSTPSSAALLLVANQNSSLIQRANSNHNNNNNNSSDPQQQQQQQDYDKNDQEAKCEYAFSRLDHAKDQMRKMVEESRGLQTAMQDEITDLRQRLDTAETQLSYQIQRMRKSDRNMDREEFERERSLIECNKQFERERERVKAASEENDKMHKKVVDLLELNELYARQCVELGARVRVYADHNERLATHLSVVTEEKVATERENDMIRAELLDLNRFHQLRDQHDAGNSDRGRTVELRPARYPRGSNHTRPRHLQFGIGLVNRLVLQKSTVDSIVADVLMRRRAILLEPPAATAGGGGAVTMDLSTFFRDYMHKKHGGVDSVSWCYAVDESCQLYDEDPNLVAFQLVINGELSELVYREMARDVSILMAACEVLDEAAHHGETKLVVSLGDLVGLLVELYPGYPDSAHRKIIETLMGQVSSSNHVHYRMLFPNLEREELSTTMDGILSQSEMRSETPFSMLFKQLFIDDVMLTTQAFEDRVIDFSSAAVNSDYENNNINSSLSEGGDGVGRRRSSVAIFDSTASVAGSAGAGGGAAAASSVLLSPSSLTSSSSSSTQHRVTWTDISVNVDSLFDENAVPEVMAMFRRTMFEHYGGPAANAAFGVEKQKFIRDILRSKLLLRRAIFRPHALDPAPKRARLLLSSVGKSSDTTLQGVAAEAGLMDFRGAIARVGEMTGKKRISYEREEQKIAEEEMRRQQQLLAASANGGAGVEGFVGTNLASQSLFGEAVPPGGGGGLASSSLAASREGSFRGGLPRRESQQSAAAGGMTRTLSSGSGLADVGEMARGADE